MNKRIIYLMGSGRSRDYWAIKNWIDEQGLTISGLARDIGVVQSSVSKTIRGERNHRRILDHLKQLGCPVKALSLPQDMRQE